MGNIYEECLVFELIQQCAPFLSGIKISNMLIIPETESRYLPDIMNKNEIDHFPLFENSEKKYLLIYDKEKVDQYLNSKYVDQFMKRKGYETSNLEEILGEVGQRFSRFMRKKGEFPHELGILLGYPVWDVLGFIQHKGKQSLYTGYWKVYRNLGETKELFSKYDNAKKQMLHCWDEGTISKIIRL